MVLLLISSFFIFCIFRLILIVAIFFDSFIYVQFLKGGMLIIFSMTLVFLVFSRGVSTSPDQGGDVPYHNFITLKIVNSAKGAVELEDKSYQVFKELNGSGSVRFFLLKKEKEESIWKLNEKNKVLEETLYVTELADGTVLYNGAKKEENKFYQIGHMSVIDGNTNTKTGTLNIFS